MARNYKIETLSNGMKYELHPVSAHKDKNGKGIRAGYVPVPVIDGTTNDSLFDSIRKYTELGKTSLNASLMADALTYGLAVKLQHAAREIASDSEPTDREIQAVLNHVPQETIMAWFKEGGLELVRKNGKTAALASRETTVDPDRVFEELL